MTHLKDDGSTACGCWIYTRGVSGGGPQPGPQPGPRRPGRSGHASRLGLCLAEQPAHHLQPRLRRPGRQALVGAQALCVVGRRARRLDRLRRARVQPGQAARLRAGLVKAPDRHGRARRPVAVYDDRGWQGSAVRPDRGRRTVRCPRTYEPVEIAGPQLLYRQQDNPGREEMGPADNRYHAVGDPRYPVRDHHLPPDRAPLGRHSDAQRAHSRRAAAGGLLPRSRWSWRAELGIANLRLGRALHRARRDRDAGAGHRAAASFEIDGRRATRSACRGITAGRATPPAASPTSSSRMVGDPNTSIHEGKAFTCNLRKAQGPAGDWSGREPGDEGAQSCLSAPPSTLIRSSPAPIPDESELTAACQVAPGRATASSPTRALHRLQGVRGRPARSGTSLPADRSRADAA